MLSIFYVPVGHLCVPFREMSIHIFCPFLNWIVLLCFVLFAIELYELFTYSGHVIRQTRDLQLLSPTQ